MPLLYFTTDVFTSKAFGGAQVGVVPDAEKLNARQMQRIAEELNLWATVFITVSNVSSGEFQMRVFTPQKEIEFGSHTTVAAAHVLAHLGKIDISSSSSPIILRHDSTNLNVHVVRRSDGELLTTLSIVTEPVVDTYAPGTAELAEILSIDAKHIGSNSFKTLLVSNKGIYIVVNVRYLDQINAARFNRNAWNQSSAPTTLAQHIMLFSTQTETPGSDFHLRLIDPSVEIQGDPPIGSAIPAFAAYLCAHEHVKKGTYTFIAERGMVAKRQSLLHVEIDNKASDKLTLRVGGTAVIVCEGKFHL